MTFVCDQWLSATDGDRKTYKVLFPAKSHKQAADFSRGKFHAIMLL